MDSSKTAPSEASTASNPVRDVLLGLAALVIVIAGARYAAPLLQPFLLALFLAIICGSQVKRLFDKGWPHWLAISCVLAVVILAVAAPFLLVGSSLEEFREALPTYQQQFQTLMAAISDWFSQRGLDINTQALGETLDPARAMSFFASFVGGVGGTFSNLFMILLTVIFLLADAADFPRKLALSRPNQSTQVFATLREFISMMNRYFVAKTMVSMLTAALIWGGLYALDIRFAGLWAFFAFLLNFIPVIGSIIAAIPVVSLAVLAMDPTELLLLIMLYVSVNAIVGNIIEPAWMGQRLGLSTLSVFLSLVFWGWVFGPVGTLLSVPLTMVVKFIAERSEQLGWLALFLSAAPAATDEPQEGAVDTGT